MGEPTAEARTGKPAEARTGEPAEARAGEPAEADEPGLVASAVTMLRLILGWAGTTLGLLNLSMGVDTGKGTLDVPYLLFHAALLLTGLGLLAVGLLHKRPGPAGYLAGGVAVVLGLVLSGLPHTTVVCCLWEYPVRHGFPFTMLAGGSGRWEFDVGHAVADLIFWSCLGFFVLVLVTLLRPARHGVSAKRRPHHATHAERHTPAPDDESVGGLP